MKFVYVGPFRLPNNDAAAPRVLNNAKIFQAIGHEVTFLSWGGKYRSCDKTEDGFYVVNGSRYIVTNEIDCSGNLIKKFFSRLLRGRKSFNIIANMEKKFDVIVLYNADFFFSLVMLLFCKLKKKKIISDITEWYAFNELDVVTAIFNSLNMRFLQQLIPNKIVISSFLNNYYKRTNNLILPPLCDLNEKKWSSEVADERVADYDGVTLIYAGNPGKKDNVHVVINVINNLIRKGCKIRFIVLGITKQAYINRYGKLLDCISLCEDVVFLGKVLQDSVPAYYKKADFMVLFRDVNRKNMAGFPTKFAESMVAGVPVITNNTSDISKFIINRKNGFLIEKMDERDLTHFFENEVLRLKRSIVDDMKREAKQCGRLFTYQHYLSQTQSFLEKIV